MPRTTWNMLSALSRPKHLATLRALRDCRRSEADHVDPAFFGTPVDDLGDGWFMCSDCVEAVEAAEGIVRCPNCERGVVVRGTLLTWPGASALLVDDGGQTAARVQVGEATFFPTSAHPPEDAWVLALGEAVLGEKGLRRDAIDPAVLFERYPLELEGGYFDNVGFADHVRDAPLTELPPIAAHLRDTFTFLPGGNWSPEWMTGSRRFGSPLQLLEPVLQRMRALDVATYHSWAAQLLGHVACDADVYVHDALAMSRDLVQELADALASTPLVAEDRDALVGSVEQAARSGAGVEYSVDLYPLFLHLLESELPEGARRRVLTAMCAFSAVEDGTDPLETYLASEMLTHADLGDYAQRIAALPEAGLDQLSDLATRMRALQNAEG